MAGQQSRTQVESSRHRNAGLGSLLGPRPEPIIRAVYGTMAAVLLATLIAQCILTHRQGRSLVNTFSYFTIQSNLLVLVTATVLAVRPGISGPFWRLLRLSALVGITVTGIVYDLALAKYVHLSGWAAVYNTVFHYIMPWATVVGFFLVEPRLRLSKREFWFMAWPVAWLAYTMVRGIVFNPKFVEFDETEVSASHFPYPFLDVDSNGVLQVVLAIAVVAAILVAVGAAYIWLDRRLLRRKTPD